MSILCIESRNNSILGASTEYEIVCAKNVFLPDDFISLFVFYEITSLHRFANLNQTRVETLKNVFLEQLFLVTDAT